MVTTLGNTTNGSEPSVSTPTVGVISDTHGLLRPQALAALRGCDLIVHAGDVGRLEILEALRKIAPVLAVRGNVDHGEAAALLPSTLVVELCDRRLYVLHNIYELDFDPAAEGFHAVIAGHSHKPEREERDGVLYFNPGSAGPRRFLLPVSIGRITLTEAGLQGEIIHLKA